MDATKIHNMVQSYVERRASTSSILPSPSADLLVIGMWKREIAKLENALKKKIHAKHRTEWNSNEEHLLMELFRDKMDKMIMVNTMQRTWTAIKWHIAHILLEEEKIHTRKGLASKYNRTEEEISKIIDPLHKQNQQQKKQSTKINK